MKLTKLQRTDRRHVWPTRCAFGWTVVSHDWQKGHADFRTESLLTPPLRAKHTEPVSLPVSHYQCHCRETHRVDTTWVCEIHWRELTADTALTAGPNQSRAHRGSALWRMSIKLEGLFWLDLTPISLSTQRPLSCLPFSPLVLVLSESLTEQVQTTSQNSKHWFTTSFLQPRPYLVTQDRVKKTQCQLTSSFSRLVLKQ